MPDDIVTLKPVFAEGVNVADGISIVNADGSRATLIYELNGKQQNRPTKPGIYIINGKKVLIK